jgi:hypothetical protein
VSLGPSVGTSGLRAAVGNVAPIALFALVPIGAVCLLLADSLGLGSGLAFWDFHALWNAGHDVLHGRSPYPPANRSILSGQQAFVYPAPAAVVAAPFALLPFTPASVIFELLSITALLLALWITGVRDWRCYGIVLLSRPVLHGLALGAVSSFLALGLASAWRWRDRRWIAGAAVAALIVLKVLLWPMLIWLALTRRFAAASIALALTLLAVLGGWAVLGFADLRSYPHLLDLLSRVLEGRSYSLVALGLALGIDANAARALAAAVGIACLVLIAWRGHESSSDGWTFVVAIGAALALSPIVWLHYFAILLVPIAIASPRLGPLWFLPLAFWVVGGQSTDPALWRHGWTVAAYGVVVAAVVLVAAAVRSSSVSAARKPRRASLQARSAGHHSPA